MPQTDTRGTANVNTKTMKSVEQNILKFFQERPGQVFDSGDIQRMIWKNKNGTIAKPKSVSRRLQELAEDKKLLNMGDSHSARYTLAGEPPRRPQVVFIERDGQRIAVLKEIIWK